MTGIGELSSEVSRRMWLLVGYTERGLSAVQRKIIPCVLDSPINGKALGAIELIVGHLVGIRSHSSIARNQEGVCSQQRTCAHRSREEI